jgi:hypothetical protein
MSQICLPAGCVDAVRIALVDECTGVPVAGASNGYILNCVRNVTLTPNVTEGDETILEDACGNKCWQTRQCDRIDNVTVEMELLNPDYEFTNLVNGVTLVNDGVDNIGYYTDEANYCAPWVSVEIFEQIPAEACNSAVVYRRLVIPKVRFQPVTFATEDPFRLVSLNGVSAPASISGWGDGPFNDSPFDFSAVAADVRTQYIELYDDTITSTLTGACGFTTVPAQ